MLKEIFRITASQYIDAIRDVVPSEIMTRAEQIVQDHKSPDQPEGFEVYNMAGLTPQDHRLLNGKHCRLSEEEKRNILTRKRVEYEGDPVALRQIDFYDGESEYNVNLRVYLEAVKSGDSAKEQELDDWFNEHYPNI